MCTTAQTRSVPPPSLLAITGIARLLSEDDLYRFSCRAKLDKRNPEILLQSIRPFFKFPLGEQGDAFSNTRDSEGVMDRIRPKQPRLRLDPESYEQLCRKVLQACRLAMPAKAAPSSLHRSAQIAAPHPRQSRAPQ